ncbi:MAG: NUDIX hydrolase YfcD [Acidobacteria bacterium]|nr:NUDIX hydrolase YfcD [Acidobacteriota bacterium]
MVDAQDRVVGLAPRSLIRGNNIPHRATYIMVYDVLGRLLVQKRTSTKDIYPGYWDACAGGVVMANESYEQCALRELEEELGIRGVVLESLGKFYFEEGRVWCGVYRCTFHGIVRLQREEIQWVEAMTIEEIGERSQRELFTPDGLEVVRRYGTYSSLGQAT